MFGFTFRETKKKKKKPCRITRIGNCELSDYKEEYSYKTHRSGLLFVTLSLKFFVIYL